jgi:hypothetical protein
MYFTPSQLSNCPIVNTLQQVLTSSKYPKMPNNKKKSNKKKVNGSTTPAVVVPQKDAMVVLKKALRSCSSDRLFGIYDEHVVSIGSMLPILLANKGARLDGPIVTREFLMNDEVEARDAMISHLRVAMAIDRLNG